LPTYTAWACIRFPRLNPCVNSINIRRLWSVRNLQADNVAFHYTVVARISDIFLGLYRQQCNISIWIMSSTSRESNRWNSWSLGSSGMLCSVTSQKSERLNYTSAEAWNIAGESVFFPDGAYCGDRSSWTWYVKKCHWKPIPYVKINHKREEPSKHYAHKIISHNNKPICIRVNKAKVPWKTLAYENVLIYYVYRVCHFSLNTVQDRHQLSCVPWRWTSEPQPDTKWSHTTFRAMLPPRH
jgi:hypothetical protein